MQRRSSDANGYYSTRTLGAGKIDGPLQRTPGAWADAVSATLGGSPRGNPSGPTVSAQVDDGEHLSRRELSQLAPWHLATT